MRVEKQIKLAKRNNTIDALRRQLIQEGIKERYSLEDELAIQRKHSANEDTKGEFETYNNFVNKVKQDVDNLIDSVR